MVAWLDLLGYGKMLRAVNFNPTDPMALAAVERLRVFQSIAASHTARTLRAMIINDGVAFVRDLSPRSRSVTFDFLERTYRAFNAVNAAEHRAGQVGARMIVAVGPRLYVPEAIRLNDAHLSSLLKRLRKKEIGPQQAVIEAFNASALTGSQEALQANFAFTKAYLADRAGTASGFAGSNCFVDGEFFHSVPSWLLTSKTVAWSTEGMSGSFIQVDHFDRRVARKTEHPEVRDAEEISLTLDFDYPKKAALPPRRKRRPSHDS